VSVIATVILDGVKLELTPGQSIEIGIEQAHRCENHSMSPVEFIEIQTDTYFGEDDIVRLKDDYGRS
jgi:mannose-6-phosphate isomerase